MINELLDFSEMEAGGQLSLRREITSMNAFIQDVAEQCQLQMEQEGLTFEIDIPAETILVDVDPGRLRWALLNIVRNAMDYTLAGGSVTMRLFEEDDYVVTAVSDTGIGISEEDVQQLFTTRFYRVTNVTEDDVRGLGLGLYVAGAIIYAHGGYIDVESEEGVGSTFRVILPALRGPGRAKE
jgi:signal transduction histidine kinase